jgi:plasmid segregation protein ParM
MSFAATDDGHHGIKSCADSEHGSAVCVHTKSRCLQGIHQIVSMAGGSINASYSTEGENFTTTDAGALATYADTRQAHYQTSSMNRVLVHHGLHRAGFAGKDVAIVAGLPISEYFKGDARNDTLIAAKIANLMKPVIPLTAGVEPVRITSVEVRAEGVMTFFDLLYRGDGSVDDEFLKLAARRPLAIIDIGGKTTNIVVITEGENKGIYQQRSGSELLGALEFRDGVSDALRQRFNLQGNPPADYVEESILSGIYEIHGRDEDVSDLVDNARAAFSSRILSAITRKVGAGDDLAGMIFTGGGTLLMGGAAWAKTVYKGRTIVPADPVFSNARGMYKCMKFATA